MPNCVMNRQLFASSYRFKINCIFNEQILALVYLACCLSVNIDQRSSCTWFFVEVFFSRKH
jgi:hypothetical protein